jgi:FkbM family methyltransferase|tara:strand:- start:78 stop:719 length:642 start_codon:yes stop_codon:yes gene_type:complete
MIYSHVDSKGIPLQDKLNKIFNKTNGIFIELGANNGLLQSNTAFFEKELNWTGILIEPSVRGFELCKKNRPSSICLNYACVSKEYSEEFIYGDFKHNHPMGSVNGIRRRKKDLTKVKAITLEKILDEHNYTTIDFLSLDTEGYELNILKGLNLDKYRPKFMLIEIYTVDYDTIFNYLTSKNYELHSNLSNYNKLDNPRWDGTHNDFLFFDRSI